MRDVRSGDQSLEPEFRSALEEWHQEDRDLPTVGLLRRLRQRGCQGNKTAVYELV